MLFEFFERILLTVTNKSNKNNNYISTAVSGAAGLLAGYKIYSASDFA